MGWHQADLAHDGLYHVQAVTFGKSLKLSIIRFFISKMGNLPNVPLRTEYDDIRKCPTHARYSTGHSSSLSPRGTMPSVGLCWALKDEGYLQIRFTLWDLPSPPPSLIPTPTFSHPHRDPSTRLGTQMVFRSSLKAC